MAGLARLTGLTASFAILRLARGARPTRGLLRMLPARGAGRPAARAGFVTRAAFSGIASVFTGLRRLIDGSALIVTGLAITFAATATATTTAATTTFTVRPVVVVRIAVFGVVPRLWPDIAPYIGADI